MDKQNLRLEFNKRLKAFEALKERAHFLLYEEIKREKIKIHSFQSRIKPIDSLLEKIQRKKIEDPFKDIQDIIGLRVVCLFRSDIQPIKIAIKNVFNVIKEDNKIDDTAVDVFGYLGIHFIVKFKDCQSKTKESDLRNIPFEIQVMTLGQDTWAAVSHHLVYKREEDFPHQLRRNLNALSGLFYVADTQFEILRNEIQRSRLEQAPHNNNFKK